jgi:2-methylisocitrate lyase-like PEP mutase family enzyme
MPSRSRQEKGEAFRSLHEGPAFVIANPWDAGSARVLEALGFKALASTSSGFAFSLGRLDGDTTLEEVEEHTRALASVTDLPLSIDLENGKGSSPQAAADAVTRVAAAGAVGASIEDWDPADGGHLYDAGLAADRIAAAAAAARSLEFPFTLTARAENHIRGNPDLDDTITRLQAYQEAGADVVFAPGLRTRDEIRTVCDAISRPVNVLALEGMSLPDIVEGGARRISVGGGLTWIAVNALADAARRILDDGDLSVLQARPPLGEWFA